MTPKIRNGGRPSYCAASRGCRQAGDGPRGKPSRDAAVTSPRLSLYMALLRRGGQRGGGWAAAGRYRAGTGSKGDTVQTTLLGLAIAFIIALVGALIGPYFIDWDQFRPQFEAEASRG